MPAKDPQKTERDLLRRIQTEGVEAAFEALVGICRDPKAPAPAKATSGTTLFRAAGYFENVKERGKPKPPEEMTAEEISARLAELRDIQERFAQGLPLEDETEDVDDAEDDNTEGNTRTTATNPRTHLVNNQRPRQ